MINDTVYCTHWSNFLLARRRKQKIHIKYANAVVVNGDQQNKYVRRLRYTRGGQYFSTLGHSGVFEMIRRP